MFGAIYIGLSGLNAYSRGLQQVSNNVTNLNTSGFKGAAVNFQDYFGSADGGGLSHTIDSRGSGDGVGVGDSRLDMKQGELRQTDNDLDLAVDGTGFLVLLHGNDTLYTRTGSFEVDKDGYIVLSGTDYRLATLDANNHPVSLSIDAKRTSAPKGTTTIKFADNLSFTATKPYSVSDLTVYDSAGGAHVWQVQFAKDTSTTATGNAWNVTVTDSVTGAMTAQSLKFQNDGTVDPTTTSLTFGTADYSVALDFSGVTSFSAADASTLRSASIDGWGVGTLTSVTVNATGQLELAYSNQQKAQIGSVALADFRDPASLEQQSGGLFRHNGTDESVILASDDPRVGQVLSKRLEASNVDLSKEFGDLILIQRGFQASSQIVSVSNDMIQQLFGIRGQG